jgi:hypothetical protein
LTDNAELVDRESPILGPGDDRRSPASLDAFSSSVRLSEIRDPNDGFFDTDRLAGSEACPSVSFPLSGLEDDDRALLLAAAFPPEGSPPAANNAGLSVAKGTFEPALAEALRVMCELRGSVWRWCNRLSVDTGRCASIALPDTDVGRPVPSSESSPENFFDGDFSLFMAWAAWVNDRVLLVLVGLTLRLGLPEEVALDACFAVSIAPSWSWTFTTNDSFVARLSKVRAIVGVNDAVRDGVPIVSSSNDLRFTNPSLSFFSRGSPSLSSILSSPISRWFALCFTVSRSIDKGVGMQDVGPELTSTLRGYAVGNAIVPISSWASMMGRVLLLAQHLPSRSMSLMIQWRWYNRREMENWKSPV